MHFSLTKKDIQQIQIMHCVISNRHHVIPLHESYSFVVDNDVSLGMRSVSPAVVSSTTEDVSSNDLKSRRVSCEISSDMLIDQAIVDLNKTRRSLRTRASKVIRMEAVIVNQRLLAYKRRLVLSKHMQRLRRSRQCKNKEKRSITSSSSSDEQADNASVCSNDSEMTFKIDNTKNCCNNNNQKYFGDDDTNDTFATKLKEEGISIMNQAIRMKRMALLLRTIDFHQKILLIEIAKRKRTKTYSG